MATSTLTYVTLDVFTTDRFSGNQLAIVQVPSGVVLSQVQKQNITREFNYSETVFLHGDAKRNPDRTWPIDIFTLERELPFAGHPTVGTACWVLSQQSQASGSVEGTFITKAGLIRLQYDVTRRVARAQIPHNVHLHQGSVPRLQVAKLQPQLAARALSRIPEQSPPFSIVRGMTFVMVKLESEEDLKDVSSTPYSIDVELDEDWTDSFVGMYFYVTLPDSGDGVVRLRTRMIAGALEDPATGSAASALCSFLALQEGTPGSRCTYELTQGVEMGRRSVIEVEVTLSQDGNVDVVTLGGSAVEVMEGTLRL